MSFGQHEDRAEGVNILVSKLRTMKGEPRGVLITASNMTGWGLLEDLSCWGYNLDSVQSSNTCLDMADFTKRRSIYEVIIYLEEFSTRQGGLLTQAPLPSHGKVEISLACGSQHLTCIMMGHGRPECPIQEPLTPCGYSALEMWLMQPKNCILKFNFN